MTRERFRAAYVGLLAVLVLCQSVPLRAAEGTSKKTKRDRGADFFADPALRSFDLEISDTAHTALKQTPRTYIPGTVREGGHTWTNVGIHLKGMGSFRTVDEKPSFALKFDKYLPDQEYCGLTKLMLNNSVQDQTYLAELVATSLFRDAGVPAARVTHCRVRLNGQDLGIYVAIEAMNKRFLKRFFKNTEGNLYEGYLRDITARLDQDNGTDTSQNDVKKLLVACRIADAGERFKQLDRLLDVERFASFAAMEMLIAHWDGYTLHTNNYRVYHDPTSDKMVFIAHGLDSVFIRPSVSVQAPVRSTVSRALFETTEGRQAYERRLRNLYTNVFRFETITNRIEQAMAHLRKANLSDAEMATIQLKVDKMISRIEHRIQRVGDQLAGVPLKHLPFGPDGLAKIAEWRDEFDRGTPTFDRPPENGRTVLHIASGGGRTRASWRCMVYMAPGRYRFEGLVKTKGVSGGGVGLRISGSTRNIRIGGDTLWRPMQHEFIVEEREGGDIELVCEFDAMTGEAWYDLGTLQIRRL
jgi:spore coat protein H